MWDRFIQFLTQSSRRERWLLGVMVFVALPAAGIYLIGLPLLEARTAARHTLAEARAIEAWVADQATTYVAQGSRLAGAETPQAAPIGISGIEQSLLAAGLRRDVSELANNAGGGITLRFDTVRFTPLMEWMTTASESWGYRLAGFSFERGARGDVVAAELRLVPLP